MKAAILSLAIVAGTFPPAVGSAEKPLEFGVLNQRSITLTAQYWNPILRYVSEKSGVPLRLKMGKTAPETDAMTLRGEFSFAYTNILFTPDRMRLGYQAIARMNSPGIRSLIIVPEDSPIRKLSDLNGRRMTFPSRIAFVGYAVPKDALQKAGIVVTPSFAGNQEGAMAQMQARATDAVAVNSQVLENYARRENFRYRVLWQSEVFLDLPIMASPAVPRSQVEAVRKAFLGMSGDPEGIRILEDGAALLKLKGPVKFIPANNHEYANYLDFYRRVGPIQNR
jgi:phosphonate transport system substrate-binding protein